MILKKATAADANETHNGLKKLLKFFHISWHQNNQPHCLKNAKSIVLTLINYYCSIYSSWHIKLE